MTLAHFLLAGVGVCGSKLTWASRGVLAPRYGRPSVTFLGPDEDLPFWFKTQMGPLIDWHKISKQIAAESTKRVPSAQKKQKHRDVEQCAENWLPELGQAVALPATSGPEFNNADILIEIDSRIGTPSVKPNQFGRDRLVILKGAPAYRAITRTTGYGPILKSASIYEGPGLRTTLHGWVPTKVFRKLARELGPEETCCFGWLLPDERFPIEGPRIENAEFLKIGMYQHLLNARYESSTKIYQPNADIAYILDDADSQWSPPSWCNTDSLRRLLRMNESVAWQVAAGMWLMSNEINRGGVFEDINFGCAAASLAQWIRAAHSQEVRLLFPGPPNNPTDALSCKIADKLRLGNQSTRDLVRCARKVKTEQVRGVLHRMQAEGWVACQGKDRWRLDLPLLPELSANWSTISGWPLVRNFKSSGFH